MSDTTGESRHRRADRTIADVRLRAIQRWPMLALLVLIFLFAGEAPVWRNPFRIDRAIWLSYAPIPLLVAGCLGWDRRLSVLTLFLNTLEVALTKFALTYTIAIPLWALFFAEPPPPVAPSPVPTVVSAAVEAPEPTPWPANKRARIHGSVRDASGALVANALVFVSSGLDGIEFARPAVPLVLDVSAEGGLGGIMVARKWQPLLARSADAALHTLFVHGGSERRRSIPLLPDGTASSLYAHELDGVVSLRCSVHRVGTTLVVLHHPFATRTDAGGAYELARVPSVPVVVTALGTGGEYRADETVHLVAGASPSVQLVLPSTGAEEGDTPHDERKDEQ